MANYDLIATYTATSNVADVTFSSIPTTYDDLIIKATVKTDNTTIYTQAAKRFSGDSSSVYSRIAGYIDMGPASLSTTGENSERFAIITPDDSSHTDAWSMLELHIQRYKTTSYSKVDRTFFSRMPNSGALGLMGIYHGIYASNTAISSVQIFDPTSTANWKTGSRFYLYGLNYS